MHTLALVEQRLENLRHPDPHRVIALLGFDLGELDAGTVILRPLQRTNVGHALTEIQQQMKGKIQVGVTGGEETLPHVNGPRLMLLLDRVKRRLADTVERVSPLAGIKLIEPHRKLPQVR